MEFEFEPKKSSANLAKHGIDFLEAQRLWKDENLLEIPAKTIDEPGFMMIGKIGETYWTGIIAYRSHALRIISVRRSRREEIELYES